MSQSLILYVAGLYTSPNQFSSVPKGALQIADNVRIDRPNVCQTRRGQKRYGIDIADLLSESGYVKKIYNFNEKLISLFNTTLLYDSDDAGTWQAYTGTFTPNTGYALRSMQANKNFYVNTNAGVKKLATASDLSGFQNAGVVQALQGSYTLVAGSVLGDNKNVAYRMVWGYTDANQNEIVGAPSQRLIASNSSGSAKDVEITFQIPDTITTDYFYRIYRSGESANAASEPNDELQLVINGFPTSGEISSGEFTVTDSQTNRGESLYTDPSQEGILQANFVPPICKDMVNWNDYSFYANTISAAQFLVTLTDLTDLTVGKTVTLVTAGGTQTYTAAASTDPVTHEFEVFSGGTVEENIRDTANALIYVINYNASNNDVYAYYLSGFNDIQGKIQIRTRTLGGSFTIASNAASWFPDISSAQNSDNQTKPNRVYISKFQQPEAVPLLQYVTAGSENFAIRRILALRDCVFIIKDDGVYQITGTDPSNFNVTLFDATVRISAPESAVVLNNKIFMVATQGMVTISINEINWKLSDPIEQTLLVLSGGTYTGFDSLTFATAYDSDQKYLLSTVTETDDTQTTQTFVYDWSNDVWTRFPITRSAGVIAQRNNKLYMAQSNMATDSAYVLEERKSFTRLDYADLEFTRNLTAFSTFTLTLDDTTDLEVGWTVKQGSKEALITEIVSSTVITVDRDLNWEIDPVTIYQPIRTKVEFVPNTGSNPSILKQAREATFFFDDASFNFVTAYFYTSFQGTTEVPINSARRGAWGQFPWGTLPWGGTVGGRQPLRTYIPAEQQWGMWLNTGLILEQAFQSFGLMGMSDVFQTMDTRFK